VDFLLSNFARILRILIFRTLCIIGNINDVFGKRQSKILKMNNGFWSGGIKLEQNMEKLYRLIAEETDRGRIWSDIQILNQWHRYTGTEAGERAAEFIRSQLSAWGIPVEWVQYPCYRSLPGDAFLEIPGQDGKIPLTPYVYSGTAEGIEGELVFDEDSLKAEVPQKNMAARLSRLSGKLVLTYDNSYAFAMAASRAGVKGILHIWSANLAHHGSIGGVWGSPGTDDLQRYPNLPFAEILKDSGTALRQRLHTEQITGRLTVHMENDIRTSSMPVAWIAGQSEDFVLISGHYDGWYEGITDNACANASMLELSRLLWRHRVCLKRSVALAWWSGHSDGKYAGSTYYYDTHFEQLLTHCMAHVNMDIAGCAASDLVALNTAGVEGVNNAMSWIAEFNSLPLPQPIPMDRFADQTFWGTRVPFAIMPRFNRRELGDGIFYWWHTAEDTLDKVDMDVLYRDHCVISKLACTFAACERLPFDLGGFIGQIEERLDWLKARLHSTFSLESVYACLPAVKACAGRLSEAYQTDASLERLIAAFAGELARLTYTSSSPYAQSPANERAQLPGLSRPLGCTPDNCTEEYFLALQTDFLRQRNRVTGQLRGLVRYCEMEWKLWRLERMHTGP